AGRKDDPPAFAQVDQFFHRDRVPARGGWLFVGQGTFLTLSGGGRLIRRAERSPPRARPPAPLPGLPPSREGRSDFGARSRCRGLSPVSSRSAPHPRYGCDLAR